MVIAFHRPQSLRQIIVGLAGTSIEMIVVNVGCDPLVEAECVEGVVLLNLDGNPGYGAAVNAGTEVATGDVVVFLNDDVLVRGEDVERLAQPVRSGRTSAAVPAFAGAENETNIFALPTPRTLALEWMALPDRRIASLDRWLTVQKWRRPTTAERVDAASGALVAVAREVIRECPMPEDYFLYWEDLAWCWELRRRGLRLEVHPEISIAHSGGRLELRADKSALMARNAVRCVRMTQGRGEAALALPVVIAWNLRLLLTDIARWVRSPDRHKAQRVDARAAGMGAALRAWRELR